MESDSRRWRSPVTEERNGSTNLRDFLSVREEGYGNRRTLGSVLNTDKICPSAVHSNRTLLDIIREDSQGAKGKNTWKLFKEKLSLLRVSAAWTSSVQIPASDIPIIPQRNNRNGMMMTRIPNESEPAQFNRDATRLESADLTRSEQNPANPPTNNIAAMLRRSPSSFQQGSEGATDMPEAEELEDAEEGTGEGEGEVAPARMSLMALLADTTDIDGSTASYMMGVEEVENEEEEEGSRGGVGGCGNGGGGERQYNNCCVCMLRHKGAAFIPCGHTFCRLCSRELWVQRGNCPLCNGYILEILDIF